MLFDCLKFLNAVRLLEVFECRSKLHGALSYTTQWSCGLNIGTDSRPILLSPEERLTPITAS